MSVVYARCLEDLITEISQKNEAVDFILIDAYCSLQKYLDYLKHYQYNRTYVQKMFFQEKAENISTAVALSSMIARYYFLRKAESLASSIGVAPHQIPYGCSIKAQRFVLQIIQQMAHPELIFKNNMLKTLSKKTFT